MEVEAYLRKSRLFRHLRSGAHGQLVERYAARRIEKGLVRLGKAAALLQICGGQIDRELGNEGLRIVRTPTI